MANLKPFRRRSREDDTDDDGEEVGPGAVAGGGHAARDSNIKHQLRISRALRAYLVDKKILTGDQAGVDLDADTLTPDLRAFAEKPHIVVPPECIDRSHPLPEYFVSSSHNTYLLAHQLYGSSCATAYESVLKAGCRCVEIDAWDNKDDPDEPKVTHGWTLTSNISFRAVCEAIRDVHDQEAQEAQENPDAGQPAPILLSLENHCNPHGQKRLVHIMKEVFAHRLLSEEVRRQGHLEQAGAGEHVALADLGSKIAVIVEYHWPGEKDDSDSSTDDSSSNGADDDNDDDDDDDKEEKEARRQYREARRIAAPSARIIPELSELGVYAQSVKPRDTSWFDPSGGPFVGPHHHLINVSESGLMSHLPAHSRLISDHNAHHLMRVYPKGTRISSRNLKPVKFWGVGAQICALNWQTFGASMQLNEALFSGTDGFVLKPRSLRPVPPSDSPDPPDSPKKNRRRRLRLHVAGATDVPIPTSTEASDTKPYLTCTLVHPDNVSGKPPKRKTSPYRQHRFTKFLRGPDENPPQNDPLWDEVLEWEYEENDLVFLRMLIKSDDSWATNPIFAVAAVRLLYSTGEWSFIRMLDLKGQETKCSVLVKLEIEPVEDGLDRFFRKQR
ncbi:hypothetical protein ACRALDRAFT_2023404 [Sodiomyces alcalophilus JCM 7366]|uniref:uncharacterized protein n=1 Tax=Sodiomyces alcalophilus JCM 7366 TaxID=591952 RepID=UPI0039B5DBA9